LLSSKRRIGSMIGCQRLTGNVIVKSKLSPLLVLSSPKLRSMVTDKHQ
jgi:hypothetical protein